MLDGASILHFLLVVGHHTSTIINNLKIGTKRRIKTMKYMGFDHLLKIRMNACVSFACGNVFIKRRLEMNVEIIKSNTAMASNFAAR